MAELFAADATVEIGTRGIYVGKDSIRDNYLVPYEGGWLNLDPDGLDEYSEGNGTSPDRPPSTDYAPYPSAFAPPFHFENPGRSN